MMTTEQLATELDQLLPTQLEALAQLERWFPHAQFDVQERFLSHSISEQHALAVALLEPASIKNELIETWVAASLPAISESIFVAVFREKPNAFIDFLAGMDSLSETTDALQHGHSEPVSHSVLLSRGVQSLSLLKFNELWPHLQLSNQRPQPKHSPSPDLGAQSNYQGFAIVFENDPYTKNPTDQSHQFRLKAKAKLASHIKDIALTRQQDIPIEIEPLAPAPPTPLAEPSFIDHEHLTTADVNLLKKHRQGPTSQTYLLFGVFITIAALAFFIG